jgi:hypothetical protein
VGVDVEDLISVNKPLTIGSDVHAVVSCSFSLAFVGGELFIAALQQPLFSMPIRQSET